MARTTKGSINTYRQKVIQMVKDKLASRNVSTISIYMPSATEKDIESWGSNFKLVQRQPLGYIRFES